MITDTGEPAPHQLKVWHHLLGASLAIIIISSFVVAIFIPAPTGPVSTRTLVNATSYEKESAKNFINIEKRPVDHSVWSQILQKFSNKNIEAITAHYCTKTGT